MEGKLKSLTIGIFVCCGFALLAWSVIWIRPSVGDEGQILYVRFTQIDKVIPGTRVLFAGRPIGEVSEIREIEDARIDTREGKVYVFQLTLMIDSDVEVYKTDQISIRTSGLLGERAIDITPMPPQTHKPFVRATSRDILYATIGSSMEDTFSQFSRLSGKVEHIVDGITQAFQELDDTGFWTNIAQGSKSFREVADALNDSKKITDTLNNVYDFSAHLKDSWTKIDGVIEDAGGLLQKLAAVSTLLESTAQKLDTGEGTMAKLLNEDDLYLQIKSVLSKTETMMDDINHYGLFYSSDKRWQRRRNMRTMEAKALHSPQDFSRFFTQEINQTQTALSRVQTVLDASECSGEVAPVLLSQDFQEVFVDLMRRVSQLQESLEKYNTSYRRMRGETL